MAKQLLLEDKANERQKFLVSIHERSQRPAIPKIFLIAKERRTTEEQHIENNISTLDPRPGPARSNPETYHLVIINFR